MPNIWAHIMFGREAAYRARFFLEPDYTNYFHLGAQGPDPFFYYNFWPWKTSTHVEKVGAIIHQKQCGPFLMDMIQAVARHKEAGAMSHFVMGFITHHILDRIAHPYIFYQTGNEGNKHQELEFTIDTLIMDEKYSIKTWKSPVYKQLWIGRRLDINVETLMHRLIRKHFPDYIEQLPSDGFQKSYRDMIRAHRVLYDPYGWKNQLLGHWVSPYSFRPVRTKGIDYLNKSRQIWSDPVTSKEKSHHSFYDLWDQAEKEAVTVLSAIQHYWSERNEFTYKKVEKMIGNRSYETGRDCEADNTIRYANPIL